jgi:CRISPR type III-A-associated RAMP protein Csm5
MTEYYHYKLHCKTLSPVHIGNGESMASIGDYYTSSNHLFFIDKEKLDSFLDPIDNKDFFDIYIKEIKKNVSLSKSDFSIVPFLEENGIKLDDISLENGTPILTSNYKSHKNSQLRMTVRQNGLQYLPGSSIKGAIKTVLFYNYLLKNPDILNEWLDIIENCSKRREYLSEWKETIEKEFNQFFKNEKSDYNLLRIADTVAFDKSHESIWETARFHLYRSNDEMVTWLSEGITIDTPFELSVTIIPEFYSQFLQFLNSRELDSLFSMINKFSRDQLQLEIKEIQGSHLSNDVKRIILEKLNGLLQYTENDKQTIIRVGAGKSFFYNTICALLDKVHFEKLRTLVGIGKKDETLFPLSRTFTTDYECFGWILLELPKKQEAVLPDNIIPEIVNDETILRAMVIDPKKVKIKLNGSIVEVQLFLAMDQKNILLKQGDILDVYVKQMSKDKRIVMVGIK